jgi:SAM-dependent methyltransferase
MNDTQYRHIDLVELYDLLNPLGRDSDYFLAACAPARHSVLDLGCGTGLLTAALAARGHSVVGIEPAQQMLQIARRHDPQELVNWICADARQLELSRHFDRIIASGHVFQVFTCEADQMAFLSAAARHLAPTGLLIFDTRNPQVLPWQNWTPDRSKRHLLHPAYGRIDIWHDVTNTDAQHVLFRTTYHFVDQDRQITSDSDLAFPTLDMVEARLHQVGLEIVALHGDWDGSDFMSRSTEIIVTAQKSLANL